MDTSDTTAKLVENTYKNIVEELGPCIKQMVVVGRTYLKSIHGMVAACRNYTSALSKVAAMADSSTLRGSSDIGSALHHLVDINKEMIAQQSNIMKSLEYDFLGPMETAADKDTKLVEKEQKRFLQMHRRQRDDFEKCFSTLKKSRRKKNINTDKQLSQMKLLENAKARLEEFCDESLKEVIVQERMMYGTVLERQCALNKQCLIYHNKGCELLQDNIPHWESVAETSDVLPDNCFPLRPSPLCENKELSLSTIEGIYQIESPVVRRNPRRTQSTKERESMMSASPRLEMYDDRDMNAGPILRAKSEYNLSSESSQIATAAPATPPPRFSRIIEYNGEGTRNFVRALYPFQTNGEHQMKIEEGDVIEFVEEDNSTGWQFGENLMSRMSGWFPLSYTEPMKNGHNSHDQQQDGILVPNGRRPLPPTPTQEGVYVQSSPHTARIQPKESEYGTLKRTLTKKLLPVAVPTLSPEASSYQSDATHKALHRHLTTAHQDSNHSDSMNQGPYSNYAKINRSQVPYSNYVTASNPSQGLYGTYSKASTMSQGLYGNFTNESASRYGNYTLHTMHL